jgi:adenosylcobinamide amidohydrolase
MLACDDALVREDQLPTITLDPPILIAAFSEPHRVLSWSMLRPGYQMARRVAWLEVRNADLPAGVDAAQLIAARVARAGIDDAVLFVTSRDIRRHHLVRAAAELERAACVTTVGLSNGERIGMRLHEPPPVAGTINTLVKVSRPLCDAAFIEAISIVSEARTAAVIDAGVRRKGVVVTGTGTDCIAVAAPLAGEPAQFAGKHTALGEAIGDAVYRATADGIREWKVDFEAMQAGIARQTTA